MVMKSRLLLSCLAACALIVQAKPARACSKVHQTIFELFEIAETVAVIQVRAAPVRRSSASVKLDVTRVIKGKPATRLVVRNTNTSCNIGFRRGARGIVLVTADGWTAGLYEGYIRDVKTWSPIIDRWAAATDDAERAAILVDYITDASVTGPLATDAISYLVDRPGLLAKVDQKLRERLVATTWSRISRQITDQQVWLLPLLLTRLRVPEAADHVRAYKASHQNGWNQRDAASAEALLARTSFENETDPKKLADVIETATDPTTRAAALDRCERVRATKLVTTRSFEDYFDGIHRGQPPYDRELNDIAEACRTGTAYTPPWAQQK
jgi:hypothetical protein